VLVLSRRVGEAVRIGEDIEIVVVAARGDQIRLGIRAPRHVSIVRRELLEEVTDENRAAARAAFLLPPSELEIAAEKPRESLKRPGSAADTGQ
jgi:carbon storage regulator